MRTDMEERACDLALYIIEHQATVRGAAAQFGIFFTLFLAGFFFDLKDAASIAVIGAADGPTAIFVTSRVDMQALWGLAVKVFSNVIVVILNYVFSKRIVFRKK